MGPARPVDLEPPAPAPAPGPAPRGATDAGGRGAAGNAELGPSLFESYAPQSLRVRGAKRHVTPLVESAAMAAVRPPEATYRPMLPPELVESGALSDAQLESVVYAGQAHEKFLPAAEGEAPARRGYFVGDGTGTGKGRQIAGIILDSMARGRKKHVWVSQKQNLIEDAARDWRDLGQDAGQLHHFDRVRNGASPPEGGVAFITYDTLKSAPKDATRASNLDQLVAWLGPDFDGVLAFDEAHGMSNAIETEGDRGGKRPSAKALAGVELQKRLPNARVVYVSATGATEVSNLAYAERLGLWGRGTAFPTKQEFIGQMEKGGVAAMESVAQSLKATGSYNARSLSFDDGTPEGRVTYDRLTHKLTDDQRATYDGLADAWQKVLLNIDKALEATGATEGGKTVSKNAKSAALSQFWGAQQRFFNQVMTSMQTPSVIRAMEEDLAQGRAPVVQLVNTMEAATKRAREKLGEGDDLEQMDVSPREVLMQYLERGFPVHRHEQYQDEAGNTLTRLVKGSDGEPVVDPEAARLRDEMLDLVGALRIPESPLDMITHHFGHERVAEATGRTQRLIYEEQPDGTRKKALQRRNAFQANAAETADFQSGKKKVLVFSDAGGTGRSYHAARNEANQAQRVHYMLQPGWRADNAVQGLGRTHRTNQAVAPTYRLVEIDELKAQKRFISTIARRLDQLGALTRGQRQAGSGGLFSAADNLESPQAAEALGALFRDLRAGKVDGLHHDDVMAQLGFKPKDDGAGEGRRGKRSEPEAPPMGQFLNRLLSLRVDMQGKVFEAFERRLGEAVERAARDGTLDAGVENFKADGMSRVGDKVVYTDPGSGAQVRHLTVTARRKAEKVPWEKLGEGERPLGYARNRQSGRVYAVYKSLDRTEGATGRVVPQYRLEGPTGARQFRPAYEVPGAGAYDHGHTPFERLDAARAEPLWRAEHGEAPDFTESEEHFVVGALLPVWDRIPGGDRPKVYRIKTDDGETVVGRHVARKAVPEMLKRLGVAAEGRAHEPAAVHARLASGGATARLANGWSLRRVRVQNEPRIELTGPGAPHVAELDADGVIRERINYATRFFVPTGPKGAEVLARLTRSRPITDVDDAEQFARRGRAAQYARLAADAARRGDPHSARIYRRQAGLTAGG